MRGATGEMRSERVPLAEHLKSALQQDVTEMCANCFNPSHLLAPCNGPPAISAQIKIHLPSPTYILFNFSGSGQPREQSGNECMFGELPAHTFKVICSFIVFFLLRLLQLQSILLQCVCRIACV